MLDIDFVSVSAMFRLDLERANRCPMMCPSECLGIMVGVDLSMAKEYGP
jgi:hypothetical protein